MNHITLTRTFQHPTFGEVTIHPLRYNNGGLAIQLTWMNPEMGGYQEPLAKLSLWLEESTQLKPDEFFVKTYSENELVVEEAAASGWFEEVRTYCVLDPIWRLRDVKGAGFKFEER